MKRTLFAFLVFLFFGGMLKAQPTEFFNIKIGESYTKEEIINRIGSNGVFVEKEKSPELDYNFYSFNDVVYEGRHYHVMVVETLPHDNSVVGVEFILYLDEETISPLRLNGIFKEMSDSLRAVYPMRPFNNLDDLDSVSMIYVGESGPVLVLEKEYEEGIINCISLSYYDKEFFQSVFENNDRPTIQDTFFGLRMGMTYTESQVRAILDKKGQYSSTETMPYGKSISYLNVIFAGQKWDMCVVDLTSKNEFYYFDCYNSFKTYDGDEQKEAKDLYESIKSRLDAKYGEGGSINKENEKSTTYAGKNNVGVVVSEKKAKSKGGTYRKYVDIAYFKYDLYRNQVYKADQEL